MSKVFVILIILIVIGIGVWLWSLLSKKPTEVTPVTPPGAITMEIKSSVFEQNLNIPSKYTCDGEDVNPPLSISNIPEGTQSLVLIVDDPDAPGGTFCHWTVWNISPETREIAENSVPEGAIEGMTDFGRVGWGGPCPPSGTHRYFFKVFALDTKLELESGAEKVELENRMEGHILGKAELIGLYTRQ